MPLMDDDGNDETVRREATGRPFTLGLMSDNFLRSDRRIRWGMRFGRQTAETEMTNGYVTRFTVTSFEYERDWLLFKRSRLVGIVGVGAGWIFVGDSVQRDTPLGGVPTQLVVGAGREIPPRSLGYRS